ncbi:DUF86 domain-containing protein [Neorhizobium galegae]|uniref:HepT-like ribonuclease domain-containing protein n=1 Tax=Neorhizobium galegae TaxID=399 RepID=UPI00062113FE|nr:HepT-like ribonuclease domain-containing protein [Neorhizobium galegae]MCQ1764342.1 DUF86 domain-containing protein [Neorhizobium galegae]MCQ1845953.1 DUF86 domain-containing protein [Neorhizobium galegae]CDZ41026.1 Hypothetical protein NGAL_HAMBI1146_41700 [Neorhizobium galegae bv. officinalis]
MRDIVENGAAIVEYTQGMDFQAYVGNRLVRDAVERCFSRVSEAGVKLGLLAEELFPAHDWLAIRNLGNVLRHDYKGVLDSVIWTTIVDRLPPLLIELETFLAQYPDEQETL